MVNICANIKLIQLVECFWLKEISSKLKQKLKKKLLLGDFFKKWFLF